VALSEQLSQPQVDAQGKPIKPAPGARPGTTQAQPVAATSANAAAASSAAADTTGDADTSKRKVRAVGPTFLPAH
jgi:transposase